MGQMSNSLLSHPRYPTDVALGNALNFCRSNGGGCVFTLKSLLPFFAEFCPQGDSKHVFYCCYLSSEAVKAKSEGLKEKTT